MLCNRCDDPYEVYERLKKKHKTPLSKQRQRGKHIGCDCKCRMNIEKHNVYSDKECTKLVTSKVVIKDSLLSQHKEKIEWGYVLCFWRVVTFINFVCVYVVIITVIDYVLNMYRLKLSNK